MEGIGWIARYDPRAVWHLAIASGEVDGVPVLLFACQTWGLNVGLGLPGAMTLTALVHHCQRVCAGCVPEARRRGYLQVAAA